jgi:glucose-6-phosphate dehydrogenase assembly protein OpcA
VAVERWGHDRVNLDQALSALSELRRRASGQGASMRTAVMTLVVVDGSEADTEACISSVRALGSHHPCRLIVLRPDPDSTPSIDATASLWRAEQAAAEGHPVFFEELHLHVGGQAASHLASIVGPFALADMPLALWFPGPLPDPTDPLLRLATAIVVDTRSASPNPSERTGPSGTGRGEDTSPSDVAHSYRTLLELANRQTVVDLSWVRLQPWRELLAGLFEPEHNRLFVQGVRSAAVRGKPGPRRLLGGWLVAQLDLRAREVAMTDARHVEITLDATYNNEQGTFQVSRDEGTRAVWAKATLSSGVAHSQALPLPDDSLTSALSSAMTNLRADRVWERALAAAAALAS